MRKAISLESDNRARGGSPITAIVVRGDEIFAEAITTIVQEKDATCHAEINAIRSASMKLDSLFLTDCYLYTTYEPCPMCMAPTALIKRHGNHGG